MNRWFQGVCWHSGIGGNDVVGWSSMALEASVENFSFKKRWGKKGGQSFKPSKRRWVVSKISMCVNQTAGFAPHDKSVDISVVSKIFFGI